MTTYRVASWEPSILEPIKAFVRAHDVDPNDVPMPAEITIDDGKVTIPRYVRNADGKLATAKDGQDLERNDTTVDLVAPWPFPPEVTEL